MHAAGIATRRIALAGNPNAGKSTLFNALSGAHARVGNYPGVTAERREAAWRMADGTPACLIDLPGCYSLVARSGDEDVAHGVLTGAVGGRAPDCVLCVVDATQLSRGLYLTLQLLELGLPCVVALTMMDLAAARRMRVDVAALSRALRVPVVPLVARSGTGLLPLARAVADAQVPPDDVPAVDAQLAAHERAAIDRLTRAWHAACPQTARHAHARGHGLWLLTSQHPPPAARWTANLAAEVQQARDIVDPLGSGDFNRRMIAARYAAVDRIVAACLDVALGRAATRSERVDRAALHPAWGPCILVTAMLALFVMVFGVAAPLSGAVNGLTAWLVAQVTTQWPESLFGGLVAHGVVAGVGSVTAFVPQIGALFFGLALLDESGYLARATVLLDRSMRRVGLHPRAVFPLLSGFACAVPSIVATRTLPNRRDRLITALVAPLMSCSARLPVYTMVVATVFSGKPRILGILPVGALAMITMYALGILAAIGTAWGLNRALWGGGPVTLALELPPYRLPHLGHVLATTWARCWAFVVGTGPTILALSMLLWAVLHFPHHSLPATEVAARRAAYTALSAPAQPEALAELEHQLQRDARAHALTHSWGGQLGHLIEPALAPLGFDWRIGLALVASFVARETLVSTLGQIYALDADTDATSPSLHAALRRATHPGTYAPTFSPLVGVSLMVFFALALQCLSTVATVRRETGSWRWALLQLCYMNALAYGASLAVYQGGSALGWA